jgi:hypothetical protein
MPEELQDLADDMKGVLGELRGLRIEIRNLTRQLGRSRRFARIVATTLAGTLLIIAAGSYFTVETYLSRNCVRDWANKTTLRTTALTGLSQQRVDALDVALRDAFAGDQAKARDDFTKYLTISDAYRAQSAANPIPAAPAYNCANL